MDQVKSSNNGFICLQIKPSYIQKVIRVLNALQTGNKEGDIMEILY